MSKVSGVSDRLCRYAADLRYEALPAEVVERTKQAFVDFLGVALGGHEVAESTAPVTAGVDLLASGAKGRCTALGEEKLYPPQYAALLNGTYGHSMDFDDTHNGSAMHLGVVVFPALLALAESEDLPGAAFLTAANVGYDAGAKIGMAHGNAMHERGLHPSGTTGVFASTLAGANLLGLSFEETQNAFGLNVSQSAGRHQFRFNGAWDKRVHVGLASHNAILALMLARCGHLGSREPLEGRYGYFSLAAGAAIDPEKAVEGLGSVFEVMETATKPYPCCRCSHTTIDAVLDIVAAGGLSQADVERIDVEVSPWAHQIVGEPIPRRLAPKSVVDAQFSLYFGTAAATAGRYGWQTYERIGAADLVDLVGRVRIGKSDRVSKFGTRVVLVARDGRRFEEERSVPRGEPEAAMSTEDFEQKFRDWAEPVLGKDRAGEVLRLVARLETLDSLRELTPHLRPLRAPLARSRAASV